MALERLDKILASQGIGSRRQVGEVIRRKQVTVNGSPVVRPDQKVDPNADEIAVAGKPLAFSRYIYLMMNKPKGVLSAARDSRAKTVVDLVPPELYRNGLFPAGRLDKDTEGLLILTNDGDFAHKMLAPKKNIYKVYDAVLDLPADESDIEAFAKGVKMKDFDALPAKMIILSEKVENGYLAAAGTRVRIWIREGKYHQVKRMISSRGKTVLELRRIQIGALDLDPALAPGQTRPMTGEEIMAVFNGKSAEFL